MPSKILIKYIKKFKRLQTIYFEKGISISGRADLVEPRPISGLHQTLNQI